MNKKNNEQDEQKMLPNQAILYFRGFAGIYSIYIGKELLKNESQVQSGPLMMIIAFLFIIVGIFLILWITKSWIRGEYIGGKADISAEEEYVEYEEDFEESNEVTVIEEQDKV